MSKEFNGIQRPTVYRHANPDLAFLDSNNVSGGFRTRVMTMLELFNNGNPRPAISEASIGKFKEYSTVMYVAETNKYYVLVDYNNSHNINGWRVFGDNEVTAAAVTGATNGITKIGRVVSLGGNLNENTAISGVGNPSLTLNDLGLITINSVSGTSLTMGSQIIATAPNGGIQYAIDYSGGYVARSIPDVGFVIGLASNGITGGTNGLTKNIQNVELGGMLSKPTEINVVNGTAFTVRDSRTNTMGITYAADYSAYFNERSLVDRGYVDGIAAGISPITAVDLATTTGETNINLTTGGLLTIDGMATAVGMRVLVKNQDTNPHQNGIYVVSTGTWIRSLDYDGNPNSEIRPGNIIPVLNGNIQGNQLWVLVTSNPIIINTTPLTFTRFSKPIDILGGNGIDVVQVGGNKTISVNIINDGGLRFIGGELSVNETIAGSGLDWSNGIININNAALGVLHATNGLTMSGQTAILGGDLIQNTNIVGNNIWGLQLNSLTNFNANSTNITLSGTSGITMSSASVVNISGGLNSCVHLNNNGLGGVAICSNGGGILLNNIGVANNISLQSEGGIWLSSGVGGWINFTDRFNVGTEIKFDRLPTVVTGETFSVLVHDSGGIVKSIQGDRLGDKNNNYRLVAINGNTTLTSENFVVLVDVSNNVVTVTLPANPIIGQVYKIKDVMGNANTNNISISGNGRLIDNNTTATINTNFGAFELVYTVAFNRWSVLSYLN